MSWSWVVLFVGVLVVILLLVSSDCSVDPRMTRNAGGKDNSPQDPGGRGA